MIFDKVHEIVSFRLSKCSQKYLGFKIQNRNQAVNDFEKDFYNLLTNAFYGKTMENVRNRVILEFFKKNDYEKLLNNIQN